VGISVRHSMEMNLPPLVAELEPSHEFVARPGPPLPARPPATRWRAGRKREDTINGNGLGRPLIYLISSLSMPIYLLHGRHHPARPPARPPLPLPLLLLLPLLPSSTFDVARRPPAINITTFNISITWSSAPCPWRLYNHAIGAFRFRTRGR
jgi:hypothetical protein